MSFYLRKFKPSQYQILKLWGNDQKWNPGLYDYQAKELLGGFWMGLIDDKPIGCFGAIQYNQTYSHLAYYIVKPEFRHKGYGIQLWNAALGSLSSKTIGLYAVKGMEKVYSQQGYVPFGKSGVFSTLSKGIRSQSNQLVDCKKIEIQKLSKFDKQHFPSQRIYFLKKWISFPETKSFALVVKGQIQGYGVIRQAVQGYRIGPLYANQYAIAKQIYSQLKNQVPAGEKVFIDIPDCNRNGIRLIEEEKLTLVSQLTRMYSNGEPHPKIGQKVYGSTAFAFG